MSYSTTNPARAILTANMPSSYGGNSIYIYRSTHDSTQIAAANFFTGTGYGSVSSGALGMNVGDLLCNINTNTNAVTWHEVTSLSTSTAAANTNQQVSAIHATVSAGSS